MPARPEIICSSITPTSKNYILQGKRRGGERGSLAEYLPEIYSHFARIFTFSARIIMLEIFLGAQ